MVDSQSKYRLYNEGYTAVIPRPVIPNKELYHESGRRLFISRQYRPVHDCRADVAKRFTQLQDWDAWILSEGLKNTYDDVMGCYVKKDAEESDTKKSPDKLLFCVGHQGTATGEFSYPRSARATMNCDIIVADSRNHRVQVFNQFGVFKVAFGRFGTGDGEFNEPTGVVEMSNGDVVVADRRNQRLQVFTQEGMYQRQLRTAFHPFSLACDWRDNLVVATLARTIELYTNLTFVTSFPVPHLRSSNKGRDTACGKGSNTPLYVAISFRKEIVVSDPEEALIKVFDFFGNFILRFSPQVPGGNLVCSPAGIHITALDQVLVTDTLNHAVTLFTINGIYLKLVASAVDEIGCLNSVSVGPEGHMVISEASLTGPHCLKIFRFGSCPCHEGKMPSSRKQTLA